MKKVKVVCPYSAAQAAVGRFLPILQPMDREDLIQEAAMAAARAARVFSLRELETRTGSTGVGGYMVRAARNQALGWFRQQKRHPKPAAEQDAREIDMPDGRPSGYSKAEQQAAVLAVLEEVRVVWDPERAEIARAVLTGQGRPKHISRKTFIAAMAELAAYFKARSDVYTGRKGGRNGQD